MSLITINITALCEKKLDQILTIVKNIGEKMATQADIDALKDEVLKVKNEVITAADSLRQKIAELQAIIDAGQPVLDLTGLQDALKTLDDINPDTQV